MKQKKAIILYHGGGELANQLWNYISIYSYTKERNLDLINHSFYEYASFFTIPVKSSLLHFFLYKPFTNNTNRKFSKLKKYYRTLYGIYVKYIKLTRKSAILSSINSNNDPHYLPPSNQPTSEVLRLEEKGKMYFDGWLFRNPEGIVKYRNEILDYFAPTPFIQSSVATFLNDIRNKYTHIVGVHIRQGDYKYWKNGTYYIQPEKFREIINQYLKTNNKDPETTCFVITSDGFVPEEPFSGLNIKISRQNMVEDLFTLASTDCIIGTNSSFGNFAAYWGNIPHIIATHEKIDWEYYKDKKTFFPNKYCTLVHY